MCQLCVFASLHLWNLLVESGWVQVECRLVSIPARTFNQIWLDHCIRACTYKCNICWNAVQYPHYQCKFPCIIKSCIGRRGESILYLLANGDSLHQETHLSLHSGGGVGGGLQHRGSFKWRMMSLIYYSVFLLNWGSHCSYTSPQSN